LKNDSALFGHFTSQAPMSLLTTVFDVSKHLYLLCIRITSKKMFSSEFPTSVMIDRNSNARRFYSFLRKFVGSEVTLKHVPRIFFGFPYQSSFHHCSRAIYHCPVWCAVSPTRQHTITSAVFKLRA